MLNVWFSDAIKNENWDFCIEMIQLFAMCPISADRLKNNVETNQVGSSHNFREVLHLDIFLKLILHFFPGSEVDQPTSK